MKRRKEIKIRLEINKTENRKTKEKSLSIFYLNQRLTLKKINKIEKLLTRLIRKKKIHIISEMSCEITMYYINSSPHKKFQSSLLTSILLNPVLIYETSC